MNRPIKTEKEYKASLKRAYNLMQLDLKPNSEESNELELLAILIEVYETKNFPINAPTPLEAIEFRLDQMGLNNTDLAKILGYKSRVSEIFSGKRKLSIQMIRRLHEKLNIPAEILIQEY